ncbi:hypothetical protein [Dickeya solani]|uniref:hypothetical protein n=1 Tax=Dickeya solani TaxID=1089444 RepID=UPI001CF48A7A|nr:hypothetical protein [Dickeya solani]MCA6997612.1 hypothetical protein [Dickeya solani]
MTPASRRSMTVTPVAVNDTATTAALEDTPVTVNDAWPTTATPVTGLAIRVDGGDGDRPPAPGMVR